MNKYIPECMNKAAYGKYNITEIRAALDSGEILEALVNRSNENLDLEIKLGNNITGVIPFDELEYNITNKPTKAVAALSKVGKTVRFKVTAITKENNNYKCSLSRRLAQEECFKNYISKLVLGDIINAMPTHIESYGVFCDIGNGITALLPTNNICMAHLKDAKRDLKGIVKLKVAVKSNIDNRITLTHKELLGTWEENVSRFNNGETVTGIVREIQDYGVFVEIAPNLIGLAEKFPDVQENDVVSVYIKNIYAEKMKVKLVILNRIGPRHENIYFKYYIPESGKIKNWVYSPECCERKIETTF